MDSPIIDLEAAKKAYAEGKVSKEDFDKAVSEYIRTIPKSAENFPVNPTTAVEQHTPMGVPSVEPRGIYKPTWSEYAENISANHHFKTALPDETLFFYQDGIYKTGAAPVIKKLSRDLDLDVTRHGIAELIMHLKILTGIPRAEINSHENLVWLKNGIFNIKTGELQDFDPELVSTVKLPITFEKDASCPRFKQFLEEVLATEEDILGIQELFGYALLKNYSYRHFWIFYGNGWNGKSTLLKILTKFLGGDEQVSNVDLTSLLNNRFATAQLYGKLANICADISSVEIKHSDRLKILTGDDTVGAEYKGKDGFSFKNYAKIVYSANSIPETKDTSDGFFDRAMLISFPNSFKDNPEKGIDATLTSELSGIFNWAYEGLCRLQEQGKFSNDAPREQKRELWLNESSPAVDFINANCETVANEIVCKDALYSGYVEFCRTAKKPALSKNIFCQKVQQNFAVKSTRFGAKGDRRHGFIGLKFTDLRQGSQGISDILRNEIEINTIDKKIALTSLTSEKFVGQQPEEKNE